MPGRLLGCHVWQAETLQRVLEIMVEYELTT